MRWKLDPSYPAPTHVPSPPPPPPPALYLGEYSRRFVAFYKSCFDFNYAWIPKLSRQKEKRKKKIPFPCFLFIFTLCLPSKGRRCTSRGSTKIDDVTSPFPADCTPRFVNILANVRIGAGFYGGVEVPFSAGLTGRRLWSLIYLFCLFLSLYAHIQEANPRPPKQDESPWGNPPFSSKQITETANPLISWLLYSLELPFLNAFFLFFLFFYYFFFLGGKQCN